MKSILNTTISSAIKYTLPLLLCTFGSTANVYADDELDDLLEIYGSEELISIATGIKQPIYTAPSVASVITADEILQMGARNLDEVLATIPGLHVSLSSVRFSPVYQFRGISTDTNPQVLMLVNEVPITQLYFGDRGIRSTLPIKDIEKIEVIRGPGSAVFGADAFAGVINVITKKAVDHQGFKGSVHRGSFNSNQAWLSYGDKFGNHDDIFYKLSVELNHTDGDSNRVIDSDAQSFFDGIFGTTASLAPGALDTQSERSDIRFELNTKRSTTHLWQWKQKDLGLGPGIAQALDPAGNSESYNYMFDTAYKISPSLYWDLEFKGNYKKFSFKNDFVIFPPNSDLPITPDGNVGATGTIVSFTDGLLGRPDVFEEHYGLELVALNTALTDHRFRVAAGYTFADLEARESKNFGPGIIDGTEGIVDGTISDVSNTPFVFISNEERKNYHLSLQDEWSLSTDLTLTAGARYDDYSDFGSTANPRAALVWNYSPKSTIKFLYGRAFRAPAFAELFAVNNPVTLGNDQLDPEIINTIEIASDYRFNQKTRIGLSIFKYEVKDLIQFVTNPDNSATAQNTGKQDGNGFELEFAWQPYSSYALNSHIAYQNSNDVINNNDAAGVPKLQVFVENSYFPSPSSSINLQVEWINDRKRNNDDPRNEIDNYTNVNLTASKTLDDANITITTGVKNLLNDERFEPSPYDPNYLPVGAAIPGDFPLEERSFFLELNYNI